MKLDEYLPLLQVIHYRLITIFREFLSPSTKQTNYVAIKYEQIHRNYFYRDKLKHHTKNSTTWNESDPKIFFSLSTHLFSKAIK